MISLCSDEKSSAYAIELAIYSFFNRFGQSTDLSYPEEALATCMKGVTKRRLIESLNENNSLYTPEGKHSTTTIDIINQFVSSKDPTDFQVPNKLSTAEAILGLNEPKSNDAFFEWNNDPQFGSSLYRVLLEVSRLYPDLYIHDGLSEKQNLEIYMLHYILSKFFTPEEVLSRYESIMANERMHEYRHMITQEINLSKFVKCFLSILEGHLQLYYDQELSDEQVSKTQESINKLREQGNNLMNNLSYGQAIKSYTQAIEICPKYYYNNYPELPQLFTNRAIAFIGLNCVPEAIDDLNVAVHMDRTFTPAWTQLGYCHLYMGSGLLALECYLTALKSCVGAILPVNFPEAYKLRYQEHKCKTILPQFIERLSGAIALTEKRAYQQNQSEREIKRLVSEVRKILAHLRAIGPEEDREYFSYLPVYRDSSLRTMSERANSTRPNILTPEVSQNILVRSNGVDDPPRLETPIRATPLNNNNGEPRAGTRTRGTGGQPNGSPPTATARINRDDPPNTPRPTRAQPSFREILNDIGELVEGRIPLNNRPRDGASTGEANSATSGNREDRTATIITEGILEGIGQVLPEGLRGVLNSVTGNAQTRMFIDGQLVNIGGGSGSDSRNTGNTNTASRNGQTGNNEESDRDVEMGDVPNDLD